MMQPVDKLESDSNIHRYLQDSSKFVPRWRKIRTKLEDPDRPDHTVNTVGGHQFVPYIGNIENACARWRLGV
jgi:hypothetical protein